MINKTMDTAIVEVWSSGTASDKQRYLFKKTWGSDAKNNMVVITIHPGSTDPFVSDLTTLFIEKHVRSLGYSGFLAVNLFSNTGSKRKMINDENKEAIQTVLKDKSITQIVIACGSILMTNKIAYNQCKSLYEGLPAKLKKMTSLLVTDNNEIAHPLNVYSRLRWHFKEVDAFFNETDKI